MDNHNPHKSKCVIYDSNTPIPKQGFIEIEVDRIVLTLSDPITRHIVHTQDILTIEENHGQTRLEINSPTEEFISEEELRSWVIQIEDPSVARRVRRISLSQKGKQVERVIFKLRNSSIIALFLLFILTLSSVIYGVIAGVDAIYPFISKDVDKKIGDKFAPQLVGQFSVCKDPELNREINKIFDFLKPENSEFNYSVKILESSTLNALALPGGNLFLMSELISQSSSSEEVAAILAHEISHVERRHSIRQMLKSAGLLTAFSLAIGGGVEGVELAETVGEVGAVLLVLRNSRSQEEEADRDALAKLKSKKIDVTGFANFFKKLDNLESPRPNKQRRNKQDFSWINWLKTHPNSLLRKAQVEEAMQHQQPPLRKPFVSQERWDRIKFNCSNKSTASVT